MREQWCALPWSVVCVLFYVLYVKLVDIALQLDASQNDRSRAATSSERTKGSEATLPSQRYILILTDWQLLGMDSKILSSYLNICNRTPATLASDSWL